MTLQTDVFQRYASNLQCHAKLFVVSVCFSTFRYNKHTKNDSFDDANGQAH